MSVFSLIQPQISDQPSPYNDVVFVIDTSSSLGPWFTLLLEEYIVKIIRYFTGFIGNPKDFYESKEAFTQFGIVLIVPTETPTSPLVKRLRVTSSSGLLYECLHNLVFEGAGFEYFSLADGLLGAMSIFRELNNNQDLRPGVHEQYCIVISNKPHHSLPYTKGLEFKGSTISDFIDYIKKQQVKLSVVSPRRIPELKSLYEQALLSPDSSAMDSNKQYKHLVLLQGIDLQGDPMSVLPPSEQPQMLTTDLTYSPLVPAPNHGFISHPHNTQIQHNNQNQQNIQSQAQMGQIPQQPYQPAYHMPTTQPQFHEQQQQQQQQQQHQQQQQLQTSTQQQTQQLQPPPTQQQQTQQQPQQQTQQQPQQQTQQQTQLQTQLQTQPQTQLHTQPQTQLQTQQQTQQQAQQTQSTQQQQQQPTPPQQLSHPYPQVPSPSHQKISPKASPSINSTVSIPSPNIGNSNEPKEPPPKKVCVDDPSNSPSMVPSIDLQTDLTDIKPDINLLNTAYSRPQQHIPEKDVKPNLEDFKPFITSPPGGLDSSAKPGYSQGMLPMPTNPASAQQPQPIDITLEEVGRPPIGGNFCQVKGRVTFQHQNLIPEGFPKRWTFKTSPPIVYLREILFAQSEPNQYGNPGIQDRGLIYGTMQILDNPNMLPCLHTLTENKMCLFLFHHRVHQTTNFQINFQMLIVKLNELADKSTLTVLYPIDKRFYQRFSEVMKKGQLQVNIQQKQVPRNPSSHHNVPGMMSRSHPQAMGLEALASNHMGATNPMGMSAMSGMGPAGYGTSSMLQGGGGMAGAAGAANGNGNGQGNGSSAAPGANVSDTGVSSMPNQMNTSSNPVVSSLAPSIGGMGANVMSNSAYQQGSQVGMSARSQTGEQSGYTQGGGTPASGGTADNNTNVLSLLLKGDRPSVRSHMGMNRPLRHPSQPGMMNQMPANRMAGMMQSRYPPQVRRPMMPNQPSMMGGPGMMSGGMDSSMMMGMGSQGGMGGQMAPDRMQGMQGMGPPQGGMVPNPAMQKPNQMHYNMKN